MFFKSISPAFFTLNAQACCTPYAHCLAHMDQMGTADISLGSSHCHSMYGVWFICISGNRFVITNSSLILTMDNLVINIGNMLLTPDQISILSKGLNFCPTPGEPSSGDLRCDLDSLHIRLRLHSYFKDEEDSSPPAGGDFYSLDEF